MSTLAAADTAFATDLVVTEIHSHDEAHITRALELGPDGMTLQRSPARTRVGRFVWLEFGVGGTAMRILARIAGRGPDSTRVEFVHMWPTDRTAYAALLSSAARAAA